MRPRQGFALHRRNAGFLNEMPHFELDPTSIWDAIARLADERDHTWRYTKKGDKRLPCDIEASVAARKRKRAARQQVAIKRTMAAAHARNLDRALPGQSIADRMLRAMQPGEWY